MHKIKVNIVGSWGKGQINWTADKVEEYLADDITVIRTYDKPTTAKVDLVHFIFYRNFQPTSVPNLCYFTFPEKHRLEMEKLYIDVARQTDHCTLQSKRYKKYLMNHGIPANKITVLYQGVDREIFKPKIKFGICANQSRTIRKGEKFLAEFFKKADVSHFQFIFVGRRWENYIQDYRRLNSRANIVYPGSLKQEDLVKFYQNIDYLLIPSSYESAPLPCIEALACGKEIISRPVGIVTEFKGITLFDTIDDLIKILKHLVDNKINQIKDMTWENYSKKTQQIYRMLMAKK